MTAPLRVGEPDPTPELDDVTGYCWAPHRLPGRQQSAYCSWPLAHAGPHVSADIRGGKARIVAVWEDRNPPTGRVWAPRDRAPWVMGPGPMGLSDDAWTDDMAAEGRILGVNRQCSIGWHYECSDPDGSTCRCACHAGPA